MATAEGPVPVAGFRRSRGARIRRRAGANRNRFMITSITSLVAIVESLFLQTGPWINLLFPDYVKGRRGQQRLRILKALETGDVDTVEREVQEDISASFDYIAERVADLVANEDAPPRRR